MTAAALAKLGGAKLLAVLGGLGALAYAYWRRSAEGEQTPQVVRLAGAAGGGIGPSASPTAAANPAATSTSPQDKTSFASLVKGQPISPGLVTYPGGQTAFQYGAPGVKKPGQTSLVPPGATPTPRGISPTTATPVRT